MDRYILKQYDDNLIYFSMYVDKLNGLEVRFESAEHAKERFFPKEMELSDEGIRQWLQKRIIPKSRAFVQEVLKSAAKPKYLKNPKIARLSATVSTSSHLAVFLRSRFTAADTAIAMP